MDAEQPEQVRSYWSTFCLSTGIDPERGYDVFAFGDSPAMADELAGLVLHGPKRATAGLHADFAAANEQLPVTGAYSVVLGGDGQPVCVIRTTNVVVQPFHDVDAAFAWDEGEGDRSLAYWREAHIGFFTRMCMARGVEFGEEMATVCERFELVWPTPD